MKHEFCAENNICRISPLKEENTEDLRKWRNDKKLSEFLRPVPYISHEMEEKWFHEYLNDKSSCFFSITDQATGRMVGSLALYDIAGDTCEIGKIVIGDPSAHGKQIGYNSFLLAMIVGIHQLGIENFRLNVHTENLAALSIYVKIGFIITGSHDFIKGGKEIEMSIDRKRFYACNPSWKDVILKKDSV